MTDENIEAILRTVRLGVWPSRAAEMHGVSSGTMRQHKKRNPDFVTAIKKAEAEAESTVHGHILRHMDKQWTACAWMLERRWPERWSKREPAPAVAIGIAGGNATEMAKRIRAALDAMDSTIPDPKAEKVDR